MAKPLATGSWITEPLRGKRKEEKVLTARAMIQGAGTHMPVEVMNALEEDVILYKHTQLGIVSRLPDFATICSLEEKDLPGSAEGTTSELPKELEVWLNKVEVKVDCEEKNQIRHLLKSHQDVFPLPD